MSRTSAVIPEKFATFGELLRYLRHRANLTQRELSIAVGYSESQISRLEQNERSPEEAILAGRFVPALYIDNEPQWVARLLDLGCANRSHAPGEDSSEPIAEPKTTPHNLPFQLTSFIGREKEVAEVRHRVEKSRLVTLTGAGGCGKTRLALQVAAGLLDVFPYGIWWVDLSPFFDPANVIQNAASVLGLIEEPGRSFISTLTDHLRTKKVLLILDNCEHLVQSCARLVEAILHACPDVHILATSREVLKIAGEVPYVVSSLSFPDPRLPMAVDKLTQFESVQLFVERAAAVLPGFALTAGNAQALAQICRRLDGIPLAIELAAARVKLLEMDQIAQRLDDRFHLLTEGNRTLPHHHTLTALINWSHDLLTEPERIIFRRLSVFTGGWTLEGSEAICTGGGIEQAMVLGLLSDLVNKSIVIAERKQGADARYRMLETIRQYALEKLKGSGEENTVRKGHAVYYQGTVVEAGTKVCTFDDFMEWENYVDVEYDNLRAALEWCHSAQGSADLELFLATGLMIFWAFDGRYRGEGIDWLKGALAHADLERVENPLLRGTALADLGFLLMVQERYQEAETCLTDALNIARKFGYIPETAVTLYSLGMLARERNDTTTAQKLLEESLGIFRALGDKEHTGEALNPLGEVLLMQEDPAGARKMLEESLAIFRELEDLNGIGWALYHLGCAARFQGEYERAMQLLQESLQSFREFKMHWIGVPHAYSGLGETALAQGKVALAAAHLTNALAAFHDVGSQQGISWCLAGLAGVAALDEQPERAAWLWGAGEALRKSIGSRPAPGVRATHEKLQATVCEQLGEAAFNAWWAEGGQASVRESVNRALRL